MQSGEVVNLGKWLFTSVEYVLNLFIKKNAELSEIFAKINTWTFERLHHKILIKVIFKLFKYLFTDIVLFI